ncbi:E3 ubiquitin-protein ligase MBR2-like isoform X1 [Olea europaea var. sylvestris]|uniref:E3 ubiquitin-protein ligase MBR2-like isoform X1 n=2 Tax=Olea europaea var. sylvestris TaxID=158386 RepID=UPI000C1D234A|nr:E3 ubiquitin-protein ligase MBR2-like isoform X1 [Olea europaea var. sylvestris]XP_022872782.1 E3 ubiquitin-protein ligase MBR2-like isoform X1 [Olea europaea var. sylvestris]XP_022872783.1 E3 ubiquitin-protein ligase MBR2-like isoform X1 [Olea europaea var. sylvestris]XP_022872784.1 E3 ubiquitin-protein ligase MBR2-like isoform X1 [Olea europaea var. sylvestris]XP_022872785.1 E3 ubiquitin-protein ligase MBR2-like isoform X1 [Olea europaea var. sylvestris]XP_022872786.1 E3 ubiquitin-protein
MERHSFNTSHIFESDNDQGWNHAEQSYMHIVRAGVSETSSLVRPVDNMTIPGGHFASQWTPAPSSDAYSSSIYNAEMLQYPPQAPASSRDPFIHHSTNGTFHMHQENYSHHASSSNLGGQTVPGVDSGCFDQRMGNERVAFKRKSPGIPPVCERSVTGRYYDVGSSSNLSLPSDSWQEKQSTESHHMPWECPPCYRGNSLSIGTEGMPRNVRTRPSVDLETNLARTRLSSNPLYPSLSNQSSDQSSQQNIWGQSSNAPTTEWNHNLVAPAGHGMVFASVAGSSVLSHEPNSLNAVNSHPGAPLEIGGYQNDVASNRNTVPQNVHSNSGQSVRGVRSSYGQRSASTFRDGSSNVLPGHVAMSDEGPQMVAESYHMRHPRAFPAIRFRNIDRNGRNLMSSDRHRSFTGEASLQDRLTPEMVVDPSVFYGSRSLFDQHRDMRLDIDNMSYEELLALGERIGNVNTGLSDSLIAKCLMELMYCSSDQFQQGTCVICLEEYNNMDDVGRLKVCGHDFHVACIQKWLSIKNMCPICKGSALDDSVKEKLCI